MPRKNMTLDGRLGAYHRIGSPTDPARVLGDRPLECALCHADKSVGALVDAMEKQWKKKYERGILTTMYGDLSANVMRATLERGKPHEQAVAMVALAERADRAAAPIIARQLLNEYPLVREYAKSALARLVGPCDVDLAASDEAIAARARACLAAAGLSADGIAVPLPRVGDADDEPED
jgi:hypothetical protein